MWWQIFAKPPHRPPPGSRHLELSLESQAWYLQLGPSALVIPGSDRSLSIFSFTLTFAFFAGTLNYEGLAGTTVQEELSWNSYLTLT